MYSATLVGLKIEAENEKINDLIEADIIAIIITISLAIHILSLLATVAFCATYEKCIDDIQVLERPTNGNKKIIRHRQKCRQEQIMPLHAW